ncbi:MAG: ABC transporter ATP-binding protein/permease [Lachnospiraceae bacterium]|nr:ABC transporter ATP-binding protein/permease [Lachnospiraceae bacterium]
MLWRAKLPYAGIVLYVAVSFGLTKVGISTTEYTAKMFAGYVDFTTIVMPFLAVTVVSLVVGEISQVINGICKATIDRNMRRTVWEKTVRLPYGYYSSDNPKELISRITTDSQQVSSLVMQVFVGGITGAYSVIMTLKKIGSYDNKLMLALLVVLPINVGIAIIVGKMQFGIGDIVNRKRAALTEQIAESAENMLLIKSVGTQMEEYEKGFGRAKVLYNKTVLNSWITSISAPAYTVSGMIQFMMIVLVGRSFYSQGAISLAEWVAYFAFANTISNYLSGYCGDWQTFKSVQGATNRISKLLLEEEEDCESGEVFVGLEGDIKFTKVSFDYDELEIFKDLSFEIPQGKITAIIGPSGSGKTTILNLLERFYVVKSGDITIGKTNISILKLKDYRKALGYVTQETTMFTGTLRENLQRDGKYSEGEMLEACEAVGLSHLVKEDPKGLDMFISEGGMNLSGGQRQRIAIAAILLKKPKYILLDEATSAVDILGKDRIFNKLKANLKGSTIVMVAHDRQSIEKADNIIVLQDGKISGTGSLSELKKSNSFVKELMEDTE